MKKYKIVYSSQENCNCSRSHDTVIIEEYNTLEEALNSPYNIDVYDAHEHSIIKSIFLHIEEDDGLTSVYCLVNKSYDQEKKEWSEAEKFDFNINEPDDVY